MRDGLGSNRPVRRRIRFLWNRCKRSLDFLWAKSGQVGNLPHLHYGGAAVTGQLRRNIRTLAGRLAFCEVQ
jgi:hypothetical protein